MPLRSCKWIFIYFNNSTLKQSFMDMVIRIYAYNYI